MEGNSPQDQQAKQAIAERDQQIQQMGQQMQQGMQQMQSLEAQLAAEKANKQADILKAQVDAFKAETERMQAIAEANAAPEDKAGLEAVRLQYEDKWKQLEADTKVLIAQLQAKTSLTTAAMAPGEDEIDAETGEIKKKPGIEAVVEAMNANLANLLAMQQQGQAQLLTALDQGLNRKKVAKLSDGRTIEVG